MLEALQPRDLGRDRGRAGKKKKRRKGAKEVKPRLLTIEEKSAIKDGRLYIDKINYIMVPKRHIPIGDIFPKMDNAMFAERSMFFVIRKICCPAYYAAISDKKPRYKIVIKGKIVASDKPYEYCQSRLLYLVNECSDCKFVPHDRDVSLGVDGFVKLTEKDVRGKVKKIDLSINNIIENRIKEMHELKIRKTFNYDTNRKKWSVGKQRSLNEF